MSIILLETHQKLVRKVRKRAFIIHGILVLILVVSVLFRWVGTTGNDLVRESYHVVRHHLVDYQGRYMLLEILRNKPLTVGQGLDIADVIISQKEVPIHIVLGVISQESDFAINAISKKNARGLMQVLPSTYNTYTESNALKGSNQIHNPALNIRSGISYLGDLQGTYKDWKKTLRAYYAGPDQSGNKSYDSYAASVLAKAERYEKQLGW